MDDKIFSQFKTVPLRQPVAVKGLHTWPSLYTYILEELERCAKQPSYLSMFKESPSDINAFNVSTFDIIRDRLKGTDTHLDIVSGELVLNTNKFHFKEDSLNKNTLYKLQWDFKSYNTLKDVKIPEFFNLMESNKSKYISLKEKFGDFELTPPGLYPSLYDLRIATANKKRVRGLCNILEKIEDLYKTTYVDFTNSITTQVMEYKENLPSFEDFISVDHSFESLSIGLEDAKPGVVKRIVTWVWDKLKALWKFITKFFNRVINFIHKLVQKVKRFFKARKVTYNPENVKKLNEWLEKKEVAVLSLKDCDGFLELHKSSLENADAIVRKIVETKMKTGEDALPIKDFIASGLIKLPSNLSDKGKELILKGNTDGFEKIKGKDILTFVDSNRPINIDSIKDEKSTRDFYDDAIKSLEYQVELMEKKYNPIIEQAYKSNTDKKIEKVLTETMGNTISPDQLSAVAHIYLSIVSFTLRIIQININRLIPFYNEFLRKFCELFLNNESAVLVKYRDPEFIEELFSSMKVFTRIEEMDFYKTSELVESSHKLGVSIYTATTHPMYENNAMIGICDLGTKSIGMITDNIIKIVGSGNELKAILGHEYGHYVHTHNTVSLENFLKTMLSGKEVKPPLRKLKDELEADIYGAKYTSPKDVFNGLALLAKKFPSLLTMNDELKLRLQYLKDWHNSGHQPDLDEYLKKHNNPEYEQPQL